MNISETTSSAEVRRLTGLVVNQVSHWTQARWGPLADTLYDVIQRIAGPDRIVPRLSATALPDQLRVVVADLLADGDPTRIEAAFKDLEAFRGTLKASQ